jgi:hypothetical protein
MARRSFRAYRDHVAILQQRWTRRTVKSCLATTIVCAALYAILALVWNADVAFYVVYFWVGGVALTLTQGPRRADAIAVPPGKVRA